MRNKWIRYFRHVHIPKAMKHQAHIQKAQATKSPSQTLHTKRASSIKMHIFSRNWPCVGRIVSSSYPHFVPISACNNLVFFFFSCLLFFDDHIHFIFRCPSLYHALKRKKKKETPFSTQDVGSLFISSNHSSPDVTPDYVLSIHFLLIILSNLLFPGPLQKVCQNTLHLLSSHSLVALPRTLLHASLVEWLISLRWLLKWFSSRSIYLINRNQYILLLVNFEFANSEFHSFDPNSSKCRV